MVSRCGGPGISLYANATRDRAALFDAREQIAQEVILPEEGRAGRQKSIGAKQAHGRSSAQLVVRLVLREHRLRPEHPR